MAQVCRPGLANPLSREGGLRSLPEIGYSRGGVLSHAQLILVGGHIIHKKADSGCSGEISRLHCQETLSKLNDRNRWAAAGRVSRCRDTLTGGTQKHELVLLREPVRSAPLPARPEGPQSPQGGRCPRLKPHPTQWTCSPC